MDFELSEEHKMLREAVRGFVQKDIVPLVEEAEEKEKFPLQLFPMMGKLGYLCVRYPAEYGGAGMGKMGEVVVLNEVSRACVGICAGIMIQSGMGTAQIFLHGTEEQKQRFLVPAIKGEKIAAFGLTEPNAGSDAAGIQTTARKDGNRYILNGTKTFISNGPFCDFVLAPAYTDKSKGAGKGVSLFVVERGFPGFSSRKLRKMSFKSSEVAELSFEDCPVPKENLIGEEGRGFPYLMELLSGGRISHSARSLGLAEVAYEAALQYSQQRVQFGQPIAKFQVTAFKLARMAMEVEAARWMMFRAAWLYDQGVPCMKEAAMAKLFNSEVAMRVADESLQIHGGVGFTVESPIQRYFRDAKLCAVTEGTSEIQQVIIAREIGLR